MVGQFRGRWTIKSRIQGRLSHRNADAPGFRIGIPFDTDGSISNALHKHFKRAGPGESLSQHRPADGLRRGSCSARLLRRVSLLRRLILGGALRKELLGFKDPILAEMAFHHHMGVILEQV